MQSTAAKPRPATAIRACTVSRDVQSFDLLIEDMEKILGEAWGDLTFETALKYFDQPEAQTLEFLAIALDDEDEPQMGQVHAIIERARRQNVQVIVIAEELGPMVLHRLLRLGAADFVPYPLPEGSLREAIERLEALSAPAGQIATRNGAANASNGTVLAVQPLAGGAGGTTFAVNLAWELACAAPAGPARVCLIDLDLQTGSVSTYLDLARTEKVYELLSNTAMMDRDFFFSTLQGFNEKLQVLTAASDMLPLDLITPDDIERIIGLARANFDFVVIDMPGTVVQWTETVLNASEHYYALMELDMRSAQNALRLIRALKAEGLAVDKLRYVLNRAPRFTDLSGKSRAKRMAESLDIAFALQLPDGSTQVTQANDHGMPLAEVAAKNPLLKEIRKLAQTLDEVRKTKSRTAA
ncbi:AAA family ATPase [Pararhodobacter sp. SW119]|uniref:AAA family ATPase n=1 Tax=Pararhodobacter sp. SW119 TaxID=2780075 RepID=UPI001AE05FDF|nr:AAA family ATPase [Pararhodobacter sp. SW119]